MTVHMIRIYTEPPNNDNHLQRMRSACDKWAATYPEALEAQRLGLTQITVEADDVAPEHTMGHWRFEMSTGADTLLTDLETSLQSEVGWYRLKYHECDHDEAEQQGCSWDESMTREYGAVPAGIP